jgi:hypothetical protein
MSMVRRLGSPWAGRNIMGGTGTALLYREEIGARKWREAFKFCFVRNPWDRAVLAWDFVTRIKGCRRGISFAEFLQSADELPLIARWHLASQSFHLTDENGELMVDHIGRFERLQQDYDRICDLVGLERNTLPHLNRGHRRHYSTFYGPRTLNLVERMYREDIERFGYEGGFLAE